MKWKWIRAGLRGAYGYEIETENPSPAGIKECMELSTKLDKIIENVILQREKFKQVNKEKKAAQRKTPRGNTNHISIDGGN